MKKHEESYLISVIGSLLCLFAGTELFHFGRKTGLWTFLEKEVGWAKLENRYCYSYPFIFSILAMLGSFLYLRRRGVPGRTRCLFLLLNPATLYLLWADKEQSIGLTPCHRKQAPRRGVFFMQADRQTQIDRGSAGMNGQAVRAYIKGTAYWQCVS